MEKKKEETVVMEVPRELEKEVLKMKREYENEDRTNAMIVFGIACITLIIAAVYVLADREKLRTSLILFAGMTLFFGIPTAVRSGGLIEMLRLIFTGNRTEKKN